jgi:hypothetical protein
MRLLALILCLPLAGCLSWWCDEPAAVTPSQSNPVDTYADAADGVMDIAAAAIDTARTANAAGKPNVVDGELSVAGAALPRPTPKAVKESQSRAKAESPAIWQEAAARADKLQRQLDDLWGKVEAEKEAARQQLAAKQAELDAARAAQRDLIWTAGGLAIVLLGLAGLVWGSALGVTKAEAGAVILGGFAVGSLPWLLESDLSVWILAPMGGLVALRGVVWVWSLGRKKE